MSIHCEFPERHLYHGSQYQVNKLIMLVLQDLMHRNIGHCYHFYGRRKSLCLVIINICKIFLTKEKKNWMKKARTQTYFPISDGIFSSVKNSSTKFFFPLLLLQLISSHTSSNLFIDFISPVSLSLTMSDSFLG